MSVVFAALFWLGPQAHALTCNEVESLLERGAAPEVVRAHVGRVYGSEALETCVDAWVGAHGPPRASAPPTLDSDLTTNVLLDAEDRRTAGSGLVAAGAIGLVGTAIVGGVTFARDIENAGGCAVTLGADCGGNTSYTPTLALGAISTAVLGTGIGLKISGRHREERKR